MKGIRTAETAGVRGLARRARWARRAACAAAVLGLLAMASPAAGQPPQGRNLAVIGVLLPLWSQAADVDGLTDGLAELGYRPDEHYTIARRFNLVNESRDARILAAAMMREGADIVFASGARMLRLARSAPGGAASIVFTSWYGAGGERLEEGGGITGAAAVPDTIPPRALQMFRRLLPGLKRVLYPFDANDPGHATRLRAVRQAAARLGITLLERPLRSRREAKRTLAGIRKEAVDGVLPGGESLNIAGYAMQAGYERKVPAILPRPWMADYGGLASYGPSWYGLGRRAAVLVDKILNGAKAGELPVDTDVPMELVINLRTAKAMGLTIPDETVQRAKRVIR